MTHLYLKFTRLLGASVVLAFCILVSCLTAECASVPAIPDKTVVLTLDDSVRSQLTFVAPLLEKLGFKATFFITQKWMDDQAHFLSWQDVAELNRGGFEIGNHSWTHDAFATPEKAANLGHELDEVDRALASAGVPKPISFGWPGDNFGPEAVEQLRLHGIKLARRGMQPEVPYGEIEVGPLLDVTKNHPLLIPTTGDAYPGWTLEHFKKVVAGAKDGKIVVLQFHGVPDTVHPWVNTPPEMFERYMNYLKQNGYHVIAMRDLLKYYDWAKLPDDPMLKERVIANPKK